jgi:hypothetical protein
MGNVADQMEMVSPSNTQNTAMTLSVFFTLALSVFWKIYSSRFS